MKTLLKLEDKIYSMAFVKESKNLSKEDKLVILEFIYNEKDMKKVLEVVEKYVELDDGIWTRVVETTEKLKKLIEDSKTKRPKSLFYTEPAGKKMLKFAGKPPKSVNKQLSKVMAREEESKKIEWKKIRN